MVSTTLREAFWGSARIGSGELVRSVARSGLIDTFKVMIYPVGPRCSPVRRRRSRSGWPRAKCLPAARCC